MGTDDPTEAKAQSSERIDLVGVGETFGTTGAGEPVACLNALPATRNLIDAAQLAAVTQTMTLQEHSAADLVRAMRDDDRY